MQTKTNNQVYAGFFVRLAAYLIDWLVVGIALFYPANLLCRTDFGKAFAPVESNQCGRRPSYDIF